MIRLLAILLALCPFISAGQDSTAVLDSSAGFGEKFFEKMNFTRNLEFFQTLNASKMRCDNAVMDEAEARQWEGKYIRSIRFEVLDPFGHINPEDVKHPKFFHLANTLHQTTTDRIIEQYLLFAEGEPLQAEHLVATYQNLYEAAYFRDVTIFVQPDPLDEQVIDIVVRVQDLWSWSFWAELDGDHVGGNLVFNKFAGLPQRVTAGLGFNYDKKNPVTPKIWYDYRNIAGSFTDVFAYWSHDHYNYTYSAGFRRGFFSSDPQWAGGARFGWYRTLWEEYGGQAFHNQQDFWLARSFPMKVANKDYMNFVLAGRIVRTDFMGAPVVQAESLADDPFINSTSYLGAIGVANRRSTKETDIFDFFPYRYLPSGFNMHLVGGAIYNNHLLTRGYAGMVANHSLLTCMGYFQEEISAGTYIQSGMEQVTFQIKSKYFTPRFSLGKWGLRQYIYQNFKLAMMRPEGVNLLLDYGGVKGIRLRNYDGSSYYTLNLETEIYSPIRFMGFQARIFAFADLGLQGNRSDVPLSGARAYQAYGMGVRLNNWKLGMAFLELSFVYYPNTAGLYNSTFEFSQNFYNTKVIERNNLYSWEAIGPVN